MTYYNHSKQNPKLQKKGKGILGDIYNKGVEFLTGDKNYGQTAIPSFSLKHGFQGSYQGPGNKIEQFRANKVDHLTGQLDQSQMMSKAHDLRYFNAGLQKTESARKNLVRDADNTMIKKGISNFFSLDTLKDPLQGISNLVSAGGIGMKVLGENIGLVRQYGADQQKLKKSDQKLVKKQLSELEQLGYGSKKKKKKNKKKNI